jgi:epoxyqueuosine reductase
METSGQEIRTKALELGFSCCGFAKAQTLEPERDFFNSYLNEKRNAGLHYLEREPEKRTDPRLVFEGTQTVIGLLLNYFPAEILPQEDNFIISKYAYGRDYHEVLKDRTRMLISYLKEEYGNVRAKAFADRGPVLEKAWARQCGLGWTGKNTLLIHPGKGSFHFIAIILTDLVIEPDKPGKDQCGNCSLCIDTCPTGALEHPYVLNPSKCLSYLTIEEDAGIPEELKDKIHNRIYGCDICQDICPYNRFAIPHAVDDLQPSPALKSYRKKDWLTMTREQFESLFKDSSIHRIGYEKLMRNIRYAAANPEKNQTAKA